MDVDDATTLRVVAVTSDPHEKRWLASVLAPYDVVDAATVAAVTSALHTLPHILLLGTLPPAEATAVVRLLETNAVGLPLVLVSMNTTFASIDEAKLPVYYRINPKLPTDNIHALLESALTRPSSAAPEAPSELNPRKVKAILEQVRRIATLSDLKAVARAVQSALIDLVGATRTRCLYYDEESGEAWLGSSEGENFSASRGISGLVLRTGRSLILTEVGDHPGWDKTVDDPNGNKRDRFIAHPVLGRDQRVHALIVAIRSGDKPAFTAEDVNTVAMFATEWGPFIDQLARVEEAKQSAAEEADPGDARHIFRHDAIVHMVRGGNRGDVVRVHPGWINSAYWIMIAAVIMGLGFAAFAQIPQFSSGQGVVRFTGREDVISYRGGTVTDVMVNRGDRVRPRQILARLDDNSEESERAAFEVNFKKKVAAYLLAPGNNGAKEALSQVMTQREQIYASLEARIVRAPFAGVVKEIYVRRGQTVAAGKVVLAIAAEGKREEISILAFLPGADMPRIKQGQNLQMKLPGYRGAMLKLKVDTVSAEVLSADEAKARYLPDRAAANIAMEGAVVVVSGRLDSPSFEADGQTYKVTDGMIGFAEVHLTSKSILRSLMPEE